MNAKINIYGNGADNVPTNTYECQRLLFGVSKKALSIQAKMRATDDENEQIDLMVDLLQTIFPSFKEEEINYIDTVELLQFMSEIIQPTNRELYKSQKN